MEIYCARHGHAELAPDQQGNRQLTEEGRSELEKLANYLKYRDFQVSHVLHSEKCRTRQTAEILTQQVAPELKLEESSLLSPDTSIDLLLDKIQHWSDNTLLVGHMPFISLLVSQLVAGNTKRDLLCFTPGTMVCLERHEGQRWIINWILRPELVPAGLLP